MFHFFSKTSLRIKDLELKLNEAYLEIGRLSADKLNLEVKKKSSLFDNLSEILSKDLSWFDYNELSQSELEKYYQSSRRILSESVFHNELNFLKSNWSKQALLEAHNLKSKDMVFLAHRLSWMILGIEMFKMRLEGIHNPSIAREKAKDPFSGV